MNTLDGKIVPKSKTNVYQNLDIKIHQQQEIKIF